MRLARIRISHRQVNSDRTRRITMRVRVGLGVAVIGVVLAGWAVGAHHSHGAYGDTFMDIQGVVKEVHLVVPHSWVYIEVKNAKGEPEVWALEATGRTGL